MKRLRSQNVGCGGAYASPAVSVGSRRVPKSFPTSCRSNHPQVLAGSNRDCICPTTMGV